MTVKDNKTPILFALFIILLIVAITIVVVNSRKNKVSYEGLSDEEISAKVNEEIGQMELNELSSMGERERMERYVSNFVSDVENGEYESAYAVLNEDFKTNYFKTLEAFQEYADNHFPRMISLKHENIERTGEGTYVLWVTLSDSLKGKDTGIKMNFVVKENELNKYELSFSVQE